MPLLKWDNRYSVAINTIDVQHKQLFDLINELHEAMANGQANDVVGKTLNALVTYTRTHFATEERLMIAHGYPDYAQHKQEHDNLTRKAVELQQQFREGRSMLSIEVMQFLKNWLTNHILNTDKKYVPHLSRTP